MNSIGQRLKFFRSQRNISQMDVELAIDAAFGSVSRMESGKVNPTKETVEKIAKALKLSDRELDYIIGPTSVPATLEESTAAVNEISSYFNENGVIGYLIDERFRLFAFTKSTRAILGLTEKQYTEIIGKTIIELLLIPEYGISKFFQDDDNYNLKRIMIKFIGEMGFMFDDEYYKLQKSLIENDSKALEIWNEALTATPEDIYRYTNRKVKLNYNNTILELHYANEPLTKYKRFDVVEYIPDSNLTKLLSHLL